MTAGWAFVAVLVLGVAALGAWQAFALVLRATQGGRGRPSVISERRRRRAERAAEAKQTEARRGDR